MRVRINQYKTSKSARELANYLDIKRLKIRGSTFRPRGTDVIINWGIGKNSPVGARQINNLQNVQLASNKLSTFETLRREGVSIPNFWRESHEISFVNNDKILIRNTLYGHSGEGIEVFTVGEEIPNYKPLYVE